MPSHSTALSILYSALSEPIGLVIATNDLTAARLKLYAARKKAGDPALDDLQFRQSSQNPSELLIVHKVIRYKNGG